MVLIVWPLHPFASMVHRKRAAHQAKNGNKLWAVYLEEVQPRQEDYDMY